jgi:integrase
MKPLEPVEYEKKGQIYLRVWVPEWSRFVHLGRPGSDVAKRRLAKLTDERLVGHNDRSRRGRLLICELAADYLEFARGEYSESHFVQLRRAFDVLLETHSTTPVDEFGPVLLEAYQRKLADATYTRTYIGHMVKSVRAAWKWAARREMISVSLYERLRTVPGIRPGRTNAREPKPVPPISNDDIEATIEHALPPVAAMIRLQRLAGMRPQDVCNLRPCDVHRAGKIRLANGITVNLDSLGTWLYLPERHKGTWRGKVRAVMIGPEGRKILEPFLDRPADAYCFSPRESMAELRRRQKAERLARGGGAGGSRKAVAKGSKTRQPTERYTTASYGHAIERAARKAGVTSWNPNQLRHAAGLEARRVFGVDGARAMLGHDDPRTTMIYAPEDAETAAEVARKLG